MSADLRGSLQVSLSACFRAGGRLCWTRHSDRAPSVGQSRIVTQRWRVVLLLSEDALPLALPASQSACAIVGTYIRSFDTTDFRGRAGRLPLTRVGKGHQECPVRSVVGRTNLQNLGDLRGSYNKPDSQSICKLQ